MPPTAISAGGRIPRSKGLNPQREGLMAKKQVTEKKAPAKKAKAKKAPAKKATKKKADEKEPAVKKKPAKRKTRRSKEPVEIRLKAMWGIFNQSVKEVASFEYFDKKAAEKKKESLSKSGKSPHFIRLIKMPIEEEVE